MGLPDLTRREWTALAPLILFIFWIGWSPATFLDRSEPAIVQFLADFDAKWESSNTDDSLRLLHPAPAAPAAEVEAAAGAPAADDSLAALVANPVPSREVVR